MDRPLPPDSSGTTFLVLSIVGLFFLGPLLHIPVLIAARKEKRLFLGAGWRVPGSTRGAIVLSAVGIVLYVLIIGAIFALLVVLQR